jgi:hypothetical protein
LSDGIVYDIIGVEIKYGSDSITDLTLDTMTKISGVVSRLQNKIKRLESN